MGEYHRIHLTLIMSGYSIPYSLHWRKEWPRSEYPKGNWQFGINFPVPSLTYRGSPVILPKNYNIFINLYLFHNFIKGRYLSAWAGMK